MNIAARVAIFGVAVAITAMLALAIIQVPGLLLPFLKEWTDWLDTLDPVQRALLQAACTGLPALAVAWIGALAAWRRRNRPATPDPTEGRWMPPRMAPKSTRLG